MCPFAVAVDTGRSLSMSSRVRPRTDLSWLLLMAFNNVTFGGEQNSWYRYRASSGLDMVSTMLLAWCWTCCWSASVWPTDCDPFRRSGTSHRPVFLYLTALMMVLPQNVTIHDMSLELTSQPSLHSATVDMSKNPSNLGMICPSCAFLGRLLIGTLHV